MIAIEKRIAEQEEYSRRESVELVGLPDNTNDGELEDAVIKTYGKVGVKVTKRSFYAIIVIRNGKIMTMTMMQYTDCKTKKW